jgi:hypothetical protein
MKNTLKILMAMALTLVFAGETFADSLEGVWKIESGRWPADGGDMVYPGDPAEDEEAMAYRVFTGEYHVFMSSFPALEIYNATMARYSVDGDVLKMEKVMTKSAKHLQTWQWTFELDGDRLTLETEGMREVWVRVE